MKMTLPCTSPNGIFLWTQQNCVFLSIIPFWQLSVYLMTLITKRFCQNPINLSTQSRWHAHFKRKIPLSYSNYLELFFLAWCNVKTSVFMMIHQLKAATVSYWLIFNSFFHVRFQNGSAAYVFLILHRFKSTHSHVTVQLKPDFRHAHSLLGFSSTTLI
jgi:hypothetical protein